MLTFQNQLQQTTSVFCCAMASSLACVTLCVWVCLETMQPLPVTVNQATDTHTAKINFLQCDRKKRYQALMSLLGGVPKTRKQ